MASIFAFHVGNAVVQIITIEITIDHLLDIGQPESALNIIIKAIGLLNLF